MRGLKLQNAYEIGYELKLSHPSWVRGLKYLDYDKGKGKVKVAPFVGAWIEILGSLYKDIFLTSSHPSWVRGLKSAGSIKDAISSESHPSWVRGLKFN